MATTSTTGDLRARLKATRESIAEARQERVTAAQEREQAKQAFLAADVAPEQMTSSQEFKAAEQAVARLGEIEDRIADLQQAERGILSLMGEAGADDVASAAGGRVAAAQSGLDPRAIFAAEEFRRFIAQGYATSKTKFGNLTLNAHASEEQGREETAAFLQGRRPDFAAAAIDTPAVAPAINEDRRGIIAPNLRPLRVLDLFPVGTTNSNSLQYVQVTTIPGQAAEVAEGAVKPEAAFALDDETSPVATIAAWVKINRQALADVGMLQNLLDGLLRYDVRRRLEDQILAGNGTGTNLRGILNTTGIGAPTYVTGDNYADAILRAMTAVYLADADPNFVALHPLAWQELMLMREDQAARTGAYLYGTPANPAAPTIWGLAITNSRAIPAATPLVGDSMAASVLVREGLTVRISDSDQDDFVRNRVTMLAEMRVAFPVWRPSSFAVADTTA